MDLLQTILLSLVEGITEFLPISSTGHLILTSKVLNIPQSDFVKSFEVIIQFGAILAVVVLYWKSFLGNFSLWLKILVGFIPTGVVGLTLYKFIKNILLGNTFITLLALFVGGVVLILLEKFYKEREHPVGEVNLISFKKSFLIGLIQSLSIIPGVSRAAATITGGLLLGLDRKTGVEFSFFLAIPTIFAASSFDLINSGFSFSNNEYFLLAIGFLGSFISAIFAVMFFNRFIEKFSFIPFGIYRICLALIFWLLIK